MGIDFRCRDHASSVSDLHRSRREISGTLLGSNLALLLVEHVLELDFVFLETGRVHIREVVRDGVEVHLLGFHSSGSGLKGS